MSKENQLIYKTLTVNLTNANTDTMIRLPGIFDTVTVINLTGSASIKLNEVTRDALDLTLVSVINAAAIDRIFLTNTAQTGATLVLGFGAESSFALQPTIVPKMYNPLTGLNEIQRTPSVTRTGKLTVLSGGSGLWTPASGKMFRLMGFIISFSADFVITGAGALSYVALDDGATPIFTFTIGAASAPLAPITVALPGNGYLSTAKDATLYMVLQGTALTSGVVSFQAWGTEE